MWTFDKILYHNIFDAIIFNINNFVFVYVS